MPSGWSLQQAIERDAFLAIVAIDMDPLSVASFEVVEVRTLATLADREVELDVAGGGLVLAELGQEGRDPDPARDEQVLARAPVDREEIDRPADHQLVTGLDHPMHEQRAAAAVGHHGGC